MTNAVAYYRVSTKRQLKSGLGLETQQVSVALYRERYHVSVTKEFFETESGKKIKNRPVLRRALRYCKKHNLLLIIATLDRLARNVAFVANLIEAKVRFVVADKPNADKFELLQEALDAEKEGVIISLRTRKSLQAAKRRGVKLGTYSAVLSRKNKEAAQAFAIQLKPIIEALQAEGFTSTRRIAKELNKRKIKTFRGQRHKWHMTTVRRVLKQLHTAIPTTNETVTARN